MIRIRCALTTFVFKVNARKMCKIKRARSATTKSEEEKRKKKRCIQTHISNSCSFDYTAISFSIFSISLCYLLLMLLTWFFVQFCYGLYFVLFSPLSFCSFQFLIFFSHFIPFLIEFCVGSAIWRLLISLQHFSFVWFAWWFKGDEPASNFICSKTFPSQTEPLSIEFIIASSSSSSSFFFI